MEMGEEGGAEASCVGFGGGSVGHGAGGEIELRPRVGMFVFGVKRATYPAAGHVYGRMACSTGKAYACSYSRHPRLS